MLKRNEGPNLHAVLPEHDEDVEIEVDTLHVLATRMKPLCNAPGLKEAF